MQLHLEVILSKMLHGMWVYITQIVYYIKGYKIAQTLTGVMYLLTQF